jgi:hypothetical protein
LRHTLLITFGSFADTPALVQRWVGRRRGWLLAAKLWSLARRASDWDVRPWSQRALHVAFLGQIGLQGGQQMLPLRLGAVGAVPPSRRSAEGVRCSTRAWFRWSRICVEAASCSLRRGPLVSAHAARAALPARRGGLWPEASSRPAGASGEHDRASRRGRLRPGEARTAERAGAERGRSPCHADARRALHVRAHHDTHTGQEIRWDGP